MTVDEPIPFQYEFVVDPGYARRIARAIVINFYLRNLTLFLGPALVLLIAVLLFIADQPVLGVAFLGVTVLLLLIPLLVYALTRRRLARAFPVGSVLRSGFGDEAFVIEGPDSTATLRYAAFNPPRLRGDFVILRERITRQDSFYPVELFPEATRERLAEADSLS
jgi:hypothetical protein